MIVVAVLASGLLFFACGGKDKAASTENASAPGPSASASGNPIQDYKIPYLDDEKMNAFLSSLKEERNPFELMFKEGGGAPGLTDIQDRLEDYNAFARKYGFKDYADYMAVWGRITVAELEMWGESMSQGTVKMYEDTIKNAEEALKKPDLDPEMKKMYEEQISNSRTSLEDLKNQKSESGISAADMEMVKKYKAQIDQETAKYKQKPD
jgi:hypothetical protein